MNCQRCKKIATFLLVELMKAYKPRLKKLKNGQQTRRRYENWQSSLRY